MIHSYAPGDVQVLLEQISPVFMTVEEKEAAIQSGVHYSEILSAEKMPDKSYQDLFRQQVEAEGPLLAKRFHDLAAIIAATRKKPVIVSLVRGGTPVGVVLKRVLDAYGVTVNHFAVSIIRDRGLDLVAMEKILSLGHKAEDITFVDGWTGKGVIRKELSESIAVLQRKYPQIKDELYVLSDIAGVADYAGTRTDALIPTCLLNATVSGLISRSVYRQEDGQPLMHGAAYLNNLAEGDLSLWFVNRMMELMEPEMGGGLLNFISSGRAVSDNVRQKSIVSEEMRQMIRSILSAEGVSDRNMIKPGIGEASRVLLRRVPDLLMLRDEKEPSVEHLIRLAKARNIRIKVCPDLRIQAVAIIKSVGND